MTFFEKIKREQGPEFLAMMLAEAYANGMAHAMVVAAKQANEKMTKHDDMLVREHVEKFMTSDTGDKAINGYLDWLNSPVGPSKKGNFRV